ncbi:MAG TPA: ParB/RepB/Spo0J family partition protein [Candidatus Nitrosotalea sp.]|nr:ParB/RepB/Spo0J family partition protein [Candidatus Nitrosotalea sp.]
MSRPSGRGLGRGLEALIEMPEGGAAVPQMIALDEIQPSGEQVRVRFESDALRELADSIRVHGLLQPVLVRRRERGYELIAGERRWRAARMAGLARIPAIVRGSDPEDAREGSDERQALILGLIENLQRADLDPIEQARGIRRLIDRFGLTHDEAARRLGKHRVAVTQALSLLTAAPAVVSATSNGAISAGHARVLATLDDHAAQEHGLKVILGRRLSVRQTEVWARGMKQTRPRRRRDLSTSSELAELQRRLEARLGLVVAAHGGAEQGRLVLEWTTPAEFEELRRALL